MKNGKAKPSTLLFWVKGKATNQANQLLDVGIVILLISPTRRFDYVVWRDEAAAWTITSAWFNFSIPFKYRKINEPARKTQGNGAEVSFLRFLSIKMKKPTERATKRMNLPQLPHIAVMSRQIAGKWVRWLCGVGLNYMRLIIKKCHIMQKKSAYNQVTSHDLKTIRLARSQSWHCKYFYIFPCNSRVCTIPARVRDRSLSVIINIYHT